MVLVVNVIPRYIPFPMIMIMIMIVVIIVVIIVMIVSIVMIMSIFTSYKMDTLVVLDAETYLYASYHHNI